MKSYYCSLCLIVALLYPSMARALDEADLMGDDGKVVVHYAVEAPKDIAPAGTTDPAKQVGLIVCFHEHGGKAPDETHSVTESLARLNLSSQFVVVGMKDGTAHGYSPVEDHERALKLIAWAKKTYPVNPRRVILWGRGEGAKFVGEFGQEHPEIPAAIITYSWGFRKFPEVKDPALNIPDFYIVLGLKDIPTHYKMVRDTYALVKQHGINVIYREVPGLGGPTKHAESNDDAIAWAAACRHKTMALSAEEQKLLDDATPSGAGANELEIVGGRQAAAKFDKLVNGGGDCKPWLMLMASERSNFGPEGASAIAKLLNTWHPKMNGLIGAEIWNALAVHSNWRNLPAQDALCAAAVDTKRDAKDRALAIDALGVATKQQIKGSYQDVPMFKALVTLLDDDDASLREKAFAILSPIMASDYKPAAPKTERAAALAKWTDWLENSPKIAPAPPIPPQKK